MNFMLHFLAAAPVATYLLPTLPPIFFCSFSPIAIALWGLSGESLYRAEIYWLDRSGEHSHS
jgi:hypothetical protein